MNSETMRAAPTAFAALRDRIAARQAVVGIIGLGYVGLPLMLATAAAGYRTLGFDVNAARVAAYNRGVSPLRHIGDAPIRAAIDAGRFAASDDFSRAAETDILLICVPTPLGHHREPDLSYVTDTARAIQPHLRPGQLIVLESTTYPGTTAEVMTPLLEAGGLKSGRDIFVAYSPEREDPGNPDFSTARIPKVVGGDGAEALELACLIYGNIVSKVVPVSSTATAEAVKITENVFRAVNIALVNELKLAYEAMGIDVFEVIDAAKTKPFGFMPFYPGPGLGGHCIPIDPFYLTWKAREHGLSTRFIELAGEINTAMPQHVVDRVAFALDDRLGKGLRGSTALVIGVAYKKNIDDTRESPALRILDLLDARHARALYHDPLVPEIPPTREHMGQSGKRSLPLTAAALADVDVAVIVTDHDEIDYDALLEHVPVIVDSRARLPRGLAKVLRA